MSEILNPHDDDFESVILGACLTETTAMVLVGDKLSPEMFYETKFGEIYSALLSMYHSGKAIDLVTVRAELASRGKLEAPTSWCAWRGALRLPPIWNTMRSSSGRCTSGVR